MGCLGLLLVLGLLVVFIVGFPCLLVAGAVALVGNLIVNSIRDWREGDKGEFWKRIVWTVIMLVVPAFLWLTFHMAYPFGWSEAQYYPAPFFRWIWAIILGVYALVCVILILAASNL